MIVDLRFLIAGGAGYSRSGEPYFDEEDEAEAEEDAGVNDRRQNRGCVGWRMALMFCAAERNPGCPRGKLALE